MGQLIDTSVVVDLERRNAPPGTLLDLGGREEMGLPAVAMAELLVGVYRAQGERTRQQRQAFLDYVRSRVPVIPFDAPVADEYARLLVELRQRGTMIGTHDLQIAATALSMGFAVLTDNARDFERVPGLEVRRPSWPIS